MKVTFVTGVVVAAAALSEFTTALVVQFCVGWRRRPRRGGAAVAILQGNRPTDRLHERTNERTNDRATERTNEGADGGNQLF